MPAYNRVVTENVVMVGKYRYVAIASSESPGCSLCAFRWESEGFCNFIPCEPKERSDGKVVYFKYEGDIREQSN